MNDEREVMKLAREMALETKLHGRTLIPAIESGQWDQGSYVRQHIPAAEAELIRRRTENTESE